MTCVYTAYILTGMSSKQPIPLFDNLEHLMERPLSAGLSEYQSDFEHARQFLISYRGSQDTFSAYRRELERYLQWLWLVAQKKLAQIKRIDFENYIQFCQSPPDAWIGSKQVPRFLSKEGLRVPNDTWRPFLQQGKGETLKKYYLSQKSLEAMMATISSFYQFMIQEEYLEGNPVALIRQKSKYFRKQQGKATVRRLSELQWAYVIETAQQMAESNPAEHERTLFIMSALFSMYLRISELAASKRWVPVMRHFHRDSDGNWWFTTVGKGNKQRDIAVSDAMLNALKRYRSSLELSALPDLNDNYPLLPKVRGKGPIESTRRIRTIVQSCFDNAMTRLQKDGFSEEALQLEAATVHWLRHTGISEDVKIRPREHVRDDAGHGSSEITDKYIDIELRERHASSKNKKIDPDK